MKKPDITKLLLVSAFLASPAAALDFDSLPSVKAIASQAKSSEMTVPMPAAPQDTRAVKEWTIMVFMNGKNSLSSYITVDMNEMEKYGPTPNINIVTQAARMKYKPSTSPYIPYDPNNPYLPGGGFEDPYLPGSGSNDPFNPGGYDFGPGVHPHWPTQPQMIRNASGAEKASSSDWSGVRRYLVTGDGDNSAISSTMLQDMGSVDMGDWRQLAEFGKWVKQNYPAKKYMLIVWNHGSGWEMKGLDLFPSIRGISFDDETGNGINTVDLARAVREMGGVDIYASDACLMQMAEVVYQLKDAAKIVVGSEENEPGDGWGYHEFLSRVHSNQYNLTPEVMAAAAVQGYKAFYSAGSKATTQSAVRTANMARFRYLLDQWVDLVMQENKQDLTDARSATVGFGGAGSKDLLNFMENVHGKTKSSALKSKTVEVMNYFYDKVLVDNGTTGAKFEKVYGIGVYLPGWSFDSTYNQLAWSSDGRWDEFTQWLTAK